MQIYFFNGGVQSEELDTLGAQLAKALPELQVITRLGDSEVGAVASKRSDHDPVYIIFPIVKTSPLDRVISVAEQEHPGTFFIFISREISASEYKRLTRNGGADWVSWNGASEEILELLLARKSARPQTTPSEPRRELFITGFVPSAGGVGNTTLALEVAVQLKTTKATRHLRVGLLDLNLQTSNVCDYLDVEARLKMDEIAKDPDRLDDQLFELFVSAHQSGVDVLAAPRRRGPETFINITPLDALFRLIAKHYDVLLVDLPTFWFEWTPEIVSVCDIAMVTGLNTVPGLRQISGTLQAVRALERPPKQVVVGVGRSQTSLLGRVSRRHHVKRVLADETIFYVREDSAAAAQALNTGVPLATSAPSSGLSKDIGLVTDFVAAALGVSKPKVERRRPSALTDRADVR